MSSPADLENFKRLFVGKWNFDRSENLDAYLKAQDAKQEFQDFERNMKPTLTVTVEGDTIHWKSEEPEYTFEMPCKLGEESVFKDDPNNPTMHTKQTAWMEGDVLHEKNESVLASGGKPFTTRISIENGEFVVVRDCFMATASITTHKHHRSHRHHNQSQ